MVLDARTFARSRLVLPAATLGCLLVTIAADVGTRAEAREALAWVSHTSDVKVAIAEAAEQLAEIHAAPMAASIDETRAAFERVDALTDDNPRQQARMPVVFARIARAQDDAARPNAIADLHELLAAMRAEEDTLMAIRLHAEEAARTRNTWTLVLSAIFTLALAYIGFSRLRSERDAMHDLSQTDELTALPNRRAFLAHAERRARSNEAFAVLFADIDGLKKINDTLGHEHGDRAIAGAAEALRASVRDGDFVARLGGDEFAAVLSDVGVETAASIERRIRGAIESFNRTNGDAPWKLSMSVGFGCFERGAPVSLADVLARADERMYEAKRARTGSLPVLRAVRAA